MDDKQKILEYRDCLDSTLASPHLGNIESIKGLVKKQVLSSSTSNIDGFIEDVVEKRSTEISKMLDYIRSASESNRQSSWKLKDDSSKHRVMYREGPPGTPFHTLLVEGYADAPVDVCLCASWEASLYKKWWPTVSVPTFKVTAAKSLKKIRIGEEISLVRMKVPWPLHDREFFVNYFELELFEDELIIILLNSVSDKEAQELDESLKPESRGSVRMDLFGGFVMKKITSNITYYRTIANMDIKLDFVPPYLINFISRQLISGAAKLFNKTVASAAKGAEGFGNALEGPMYVRLRLSLYSKNKPNEVPKEEVPEIGKSTTALPEVSQPNISNEEVDLDLDTAAFAEGCSWNKDKRSCPS